MGLGKILSFLAHIDDPVVRDFTTSAEERMKNMAIEANDGENWFDKNVTDRFSRWLDKKGYLETLVGVKNYRKNVIDAYDYSSSNIEKICSMARQEDRLVGSSIATHKREAENVVVLVEALANAINPAPGDPMEAASISERLMWYTTRWVRIRGELVRVDALESDSKNLHNQLSKYELTDDDIKMFCGQSDSKDAFSGYTDYIGEALDWNALGIVYVGVGIVMYKGVQMTIDELVSLISKEGYSEKQVRKQMESLIAGVISADSKVQKFVKTNKDATDFLQSKIKDYLKDEDTDGAFKDFVEACGGISTVKAMVDNCPALVDYMFNDYKDGIELIENLKVTAESGNMSPEMLKALENIEETYNSKWAGACLKTADMATDALKNYTEHEIKDWIKDECGDLSLVSTVTEIIGIEDTAKGADKLNTLMAVQGDLQHSFEAAIEKVHSGEYTDADVNNVNNLFNMLKANTTSMLETYRDMSVGDPDKQIEINQHIADLERMTVNNYSPWMFK